MSQHFECMLCLDLKPDTPRGVLDALEHMVCGGQDHSVPGSAQSETNEAPPMLSLAEWEESALPGCAWRHFSRQYRFTQGGVDHFRHTFGFRTQLLDDVFYEWWFPFLEWIASYSETEGFVGYYLEELNRNPTLIYFSDGRVGTVTPADQPEWIA